MSRLIASLIIGPLVIYLSVLYIPGISVKPDNFGKTEAILVIGLILGLANYFLKPLLNLISLPLRILTFGLFGLIINTGLIILVDAFVPYLAIQGILPYLYIGFLLGIFNLLIVKTFS